MDQNTLKFTRNRQKVVQLGGQLAKSSTAHLQKVVQSSFVCTTFCKYDIRLVRVFAKSSTIVICTTFCKHNKFVLHL